MDNKHDKLQTILIQSAYVKGLDRALRLNDIALASATKEAQDDMYRAKSDYDHSDEWEAKSTGAYEFAEQQTSTHLREELNLELAKLKVLKASFKAEFGENEYRAMLDIKEKLSQGRALEREQQARQDKLNTEAVSRLLSVLTSRKFNIELKSVISIPVLARQGIQALERKVSSHYSVLLLSDSQQAVSTIAKQNSALRKVSQNHFLDIIELADYMIVLLSEIKGIEDSESKTILMNYLNILVINLAKLNCTSAESE